MSWYRTGTVSVTNGSTGVTGSGTAWVNNVFPGDAFIGPSGVYHEVEEVISNTALVLVEAYTGATSVGAAYKVIPTQGRVRELAAAVAQLVSDYGSVESALTVLAGNLGLGKTPNASARLDVAGQVWVDAPSGDATLRLLTSGAEKGKLAVTSAGRGYLESNGAEVLTWLNGNVGVGTAAPSQKLDVAGTIRASSAAGTAPKFSLFQSGVVAWEVENAATTGVFGISNGAGYAFRSESVSAGVAGVYVAGSGNVGVGTTAPAVKLEVSGASTVLRVNGTAGTPATLQLSSAGVAQWSLSANQDGGGEFGLAYGGTRYLTATSSGNVGVGVTSPLSKLHVAGPSAAVRVSATANTQRRGLVMDDAAGTVYGSLLMELETGNLAMTAGATGWGGNISMSTNGTERMRIDGSGNLLVNRTSDSGYGQLQVAISSGSSIADFSCSSGSAGVIRVRATTADSAYAYFQNSTTGFSLSDGLQIGVDSVGRAYVANNELNDLVLQTSAQTRLVVDAAGNTRIRLQSVAPTLTDNAEFNIIRISDSVIRFRMRGNDGTTRYADMNLTAS